MVERNPHNLAERVADGQDTPADGDSAGPNASRQRNLALLGNISKAFRTAAATVTSEERPCLFQWRHLSVEEKLGEGGFGVVYRAWDPILKRHVALKLSRDGDDPLRNDWIITEARRLARVRHPNVLAVHGADRDDNQAGIWSDLLNGETLGDILKREGQLPWSTVMPLAIALSDALSTIHSRQLVHGDIKPANVMVRRNGEPVLMDFGASGDTCGSPSFGSPIVMAPELFLGQSASPASDVYALGAVLFRALTGHFPVEAETLDELAAKHESGHPADCTSLTKPVARIIRRCLARDPATRLTAVQLSSALTLLAEAPERQRKRRATGMIIAGLAGTALAAMLGMWQTNQARQTAEDQRQQAEVSLEFLENMLKAPRMDISGTEVQVGEVLDNAARQLNHTDLPAASRARLHFILARTYDSIERFDAALEQLAQAERNTPSSAFRAQLLVDRAGLARSIEDVAMADLAVEHLAALISENPSLEPEFAAQVLFQRALTANFEGNAKLALELAQQVEQMPQAFASVSWAYAELHRLMASLLRDEARISEAIDYAQKSLDWHQQSGEGKQSVGAVSARHELTTLLLVANNYADAEALTRENLRYLDDMAPGISSRRIAISLSLFDAVGRQGRFDEAIAGYHALLEEARQYAGPDSKSALSIIGNIGVLLAESGNYDEAAKYTRQALEISQRKFGPDKLRSRLFASNLAELMVLQKRGVEALDFAEETWKRNSQLFGESQLYTLFTADVYGLALARWGSGEDALRLLDGTLAQKADLFGEDNPFTWDTQAYRVEALAAVSRHDEAVALAQRVVDHRKAVLGVDNHKTQVSVNLLAQLHGADQH